MEDFIKRFPHVGYWIMGAMLMLIVFLVQQGLSNNTKAMDRLSSTLTMIELKMGAHDIKLENHEVRLDKGGL